MALGEAVWRQEEAFNSQLPSKEVVYRVNGFKIVYPADFVL
jgi:hypothetical protein